MKLLNLNVERSRHLERFLPFVRDFRPDIACLQELQQSNIERIKFDTGLEHCHWVPMTCHPNEAPDNPFGVGIFSSIAFETVDVVSYAGAGDGTSAFDTTSEIGKLATCRYCVAVSELKADECVFTFGTTHFPWTSDGGTRPYQEEAADKLIEQLNDRPIVLIGDFNAPRGGPIWTKLSEVWTDHIPLSETTSIDPHLHRAGPLELLVDGLFTSEHYDCNDVLLHTGVSDHKAITATVSRTQ